MPTSVLVDGQGCEIGTIAGPAEWASDDAVKLIQAALKPARRALRRRRIPRPNVEVATDAGANICRRRRLRPPRQGLDRRLLQIGYWISGPKRQPAVCVLAA